MTQWRVLAVCAVAAVAMVGCGTAPPAYWQPPVVGPVTTSSRQVAAGSTFEITTYVSDDNQVSELRLEFWVGDLLATIDCDLPAVGHTLSTDGAFRLNQPAKVVTVAFACTLPDFATNGEWDVTVLAADGEVSGGAYTWGHNSTTFEVTGGTDDQTPPVVESLVIAPQPVVVGAPFTVTVRLSDEHLGSADSTQFANLWGPNDAVSQTCWQSSSTRLSPTVHEWVFACPAQTVPGRYDTLAEVFDAIGHKVWARSEFDILAAP